MAFTLYRWDDASAPLLHGLAGSMIAVLKACLVDGYGAKSAAGWSVTMSDGPPIYNAVFRNNTAGGGFGSYFAILDDGSATVSTGISARIRMWEAVTGYDTGTNGTTAKFFRKSSVASSTARPWVVIADDRFCYVILWPYNTAVGIVDYGYLYWFGDGVPLRNGDTFFSLVAGATATNTDPATNSISNPSVSAAGTFMHAQRNITLLGSFVSPRITLADSPTTSGFGFTTFGYSTFPFMGKKIIIKPWINDVGAYTMRGWLPGLYFPFHYSTLFNNFTTHTVGGRTYTAIKIYSQSVVMFDLANSRE